MKSKFILIIIALFCYTSSTIFLDLIFLTSEDGVIEYMSVAFWVIGFIYAIRVILNKNFKKKIVVFVLLAVIFISIGEEISWGQRIFHIDTPDFFVTANKQSEINFHNLYVLSGGSSWRNFFSTGEFTYYQIFGAQNLFRIGFIIFFLLFPLLVKTKKGAYYLPIIGYYKPDNYFTTSIWLFLLFSFLITINRPSYVLDPIQEIREMSYALFMGIYMIEYFKNKKQHARSQFDQTLVAEN